MQTFISKNLAGDNNDNHPEDNSLNIIKIRINTVVMYAIITDLCNIPL